MTTHHISKNMFKMIFFNPESNTYVRDFPGGPVVKEPHFQGRGPGFDP